MHPDAAKPERKRSFFPDYSSLPKPMWSGPGRRRMVGKQTPIEDVALPSQKRNSNSHKASTQSVQWSEAEQGELENARDWRHRVRLEKRILHNRTAIQLGKHMLAPFDEGQNLECALCRKSTRIANLSKFVMESCGGQQDQEVPVEPGAQRASVQVAKRISWVKEHNQKAQQNGDLHIFNVPEQLDDALMCSRCQATHTEGWRRFGKLAKSICPARFSA